MAVRWLVWGTAGAFAYLLGCGGQGAVAGDSRDASPLDAMAHADAGGDSRPARDGSAADAGSGCPGVPIVPTATGYVSPGSNSVDIHGSWFVYSDCNDEGEPDGGPNCSDVIQPPKSSFPNVGGKMCTSGHTSTASGAWGAGIALELNDGPPQEPYDTVTHKVVGFCFQLSGKTIPSTSIRVAFPTTEDNDDAPFESVSTLGQHTVLFSATAQGSWVTTPTTFDPTMVTLIQFQIPSSTTEEVAWDFCIEGLTAVTK
jgi:hypothetical protein